jgi:hypothetical protein
MLTSLRPMGVRGLGRLGQSAPSPLVSSIASAITQMEGTIAPNAQYPNGSLAYQNNNPGNLIYVGQSGATPGAGGFAKFDTVADGQQALYNQIQTQINSGQNLTQFFNQYAPGGTSNAAGGVQTSAATQNYINTVSQQIGIDPSVPLNSVASSSGTAAVSDSSDDSSTDIGTQIANAVSSIDLSDPTTLAVIGIAGALALYYVL